MVEPKDGVIFFDRGLAFAAKGDTAAAIADFTAAIGIDPKDIDSIVHLSEALMSKGDQAGRSASSIAG